MPERYPATSALVPGGAGIELPTAPSVDLDPAGAWAHQRDAVDRFYTADVFMHTWDLARATGQDETLDEETCRRLYEGILPMDEVLRASGQYGPRVPVPDDADPQTLLLAFIGRQP